jgi:hypothetical protein
MAKKKKTKNSLNKIWATNNENKTKQNPTCLLP